MKTQNIENYLNSFANNVVKDAENLLHSKKGQTALGQSIRATVKKDANGFSVKFFMLDYGTFLDKGVSGNKKKISYTNTEGKKVSSPYSYTTKGPPIDILSKWIKKKGIKPTGTGRGRSKNTGQYISGLAYLISKKIKRDGIKSISFFTTHSTLQYNKLQDDFLKVFTEDIRTYITTFTKYK